MPFVSESVKNKSGRKCNPVVAKGWCTTTMVFYQVVGKGDVLEYCVLAPFTGMKCCHKKVDLFVDFRALVGRPT